MRGFAPLATLVALCMMLISVLVFLVMPDGLQGWAIIPFALALPVGVGVEWYWTNR
jgi:hypothetical protein